MSSRKQSKINALISSLIQESKMSFSRDITFNDTTATISFPIKLTSSNQLNWTFSIKSGTNTVSTNGSVIIEPSATNSANKDIHTAFIKEGLKTVENARGRDAKATAAKMLYDYMLMCAMDFVHTYERYKNTVIAKAYELKKEAPDQTAMITSLDKLLIALGVPLEPLTLKVTCNSNCPGCTVKPTEAKPTETKESSKIVNNSTEDNNTEYLLFVTIAKRLGCDYVIKNSKDYYGYYKGTVKRGFIKSNNSAEMIEYYLKRWGGPNKTYQRITLMKDLFAKNKLTFTDDVMSLYDDWQHTYQPTGKTNRFIKMCAFINNYKKLFHSS